LWDLLVQLDLQDSQDFKVPLALLDLEALLELLVTLDRKDSLEIKESLDQLERLGQLVMLVLMGQMEHLANRDLLVIPDPQAFRVFAVYKDQLVTRVTRVELVLPVMRATLVSKVPPEAVDLQELLDWSEELERLELLGSREHRALPDCRGLVVIREFWEMLGSSDSRDRRASRVLLDQLVRVGSQVPRVSREQLVILVQPGRLDLLDNWVCLELLVCKATKVQLVTLEVPDQQVYKEELEPQVHGVWLPSRVQEVTPALPALREPPGRLDQLALLVPGACRVVLAYLVPRGPPEQRARLANLDFRVSLGL
jgi:uncharacterized protein YlaN (UPF0358 family)